MDRTAAAGTVRTILGEHTRPRASVEALEAGPRTSGRIELTVADVR